MMKSTNINNPVVRVAMAENATAYKVGLYDSRTGGHSYSDWTSGITYAVIPDEGESPIFLGARHFSGRVWLDEGSRCFDRDNPMPPKKAWEAIPWGDLPRFVRARFWALTGIPLVTEREKKAIREETSFLLATYGEGERECFTPAQWAFVAALEEVNRSPQWDLFNPVRVACDPHGKNLRDFSPRFSGRVGTFWSPSQEAAPLGTIISPNWPQFGGCAYVAWRPGGREAAFAAAKAAEEAKRAQERAYGRECRVAADFYGVPYPVALAIGPVYLEEFCRLVRRISPSLEGREYTNRDEQYAPIDPYVLDEGVRGELFCGIYRRKRAIKALLPDMGRDLSERIARMGQRNSRRVAEYIAALHPSTKWYSLQGLSR